MEYRHSMFDDAVDKTLLDACLELEKHCQFKFLEIGIDEDYVHFLVQSVPSHSITKLVTKIKSITASEIFRLCPHVKKRLWGGEFWSEDYFVSTVGRHGDEHAIRNYVKGQGKEYQKLHEDRQLLLF